MVGFILGRHGQGGRVVLPGFKDAGLVSGGIGGFWQSCGLGYSDEKKRGNWSYDGWV